MNRYAKNQDYAIDKKRSKQNKHDVVRKIWIKCDKNDKSIYKDHEHRLHIDSRLIDCSFECIVILNDDEKDWNVNEDQDNWHLKITKSDHNHESDHSFAYSIYRKTTRIAKVMKKIEKEMRIETTTKFILTELRLNENEKNLIFKARDIYNVKTFLRNEELDSLTSTQILMRALSDNDKWFMKIERNEQQRLQYLFFIAHCMQKLLIENSKVLIMNCIYKTNKYKMSLLIINDVTNLNIFFYVDFCFMKDENFSDYVWALEAMKELYESLQLQFSTVILSNDNKALASVITEIYDVDQMNHELCIWHIEKNMLKHCKSRRYFDINEKFEIFMRRFKNIIYVSTETILHKLWNNLWRDIDVNIVMYIEKTH